MVTSFRTLLDAIMLFDSLLTMSKQKSSNLKVF